MPDCPKLRQFTCTYFNQGMGGSVLLKFVLLAIMLALLVGGSLLIVLGITSLVRHGSVVQKREEPKAGEANPVTVEDDHRRAA